ncbi:hypothetical protein BDQ17DRAFT_1320932 [Cyathus striatus]|nr:hypothetical protein BDQ17DRAFT_1320932 [Cyathus striatus]
MHSMFQHLGTNYVPSVDEARQIQDFLKISSKEAHDIDIEIDRVQRQLEHLQTKRLKISDLAEQHRALLSPIRRLNRDTLEAIFLACLPTDRNPCMSATEAPMLLTQISSSWRNITHSTPRLWAAIHIVFPSFDTQGYPYPYPTSYLSEREALLRLKLTQREVGAMEWLERAGAHPLSISIYQSVLNWAPIHLQAEVAEQYDNHVQKYRELCSSFINNTIVPYHKRWHDIDIRIFDPKTCLGTTYRIDPRTAFSWPYPSEITLKLNVVSNKGNSGILSYATYTWPQNIIPLDHLTMLSLSLPPIPDAVDFVKHLYLPSIQQFDFEFTGGRQTDFTLAEDILKIVLHASGGGITGTLYATLAIIIC